jgi:hypothetical protein
MLRKLMSHPNARRYGKIAVFAGHCAFCAGVGALMGPTSLIGFLLCIPSVLLTVVVCGS